MKGTERLLLVDDNGTLLSLLKQFLTHLGYRVEAFDVPADALKWSQDASNRELHLLITGEEFYPVDGKELFLRLQKQYPDLKALIMRELSEAGMSPHPPAEAEPIRMRYIQKPFMPAELATRARSLLDGDGQRT